MSNPQSLIEKIEAPPAEQRIEVEEICGLHRVARTGFGPVVNTRRGPQQRQRPGAAEARATRLRRHDYASVAEPRGN
jgi:hypothetical protein